MSDPQTSAAFKPYTFEIPLDDFPSSFDVALNGSTLKVPNSYGKAVEPGLLDPDEIRRLSVSTIGGLSDDGRTGRSGSRAAHGRFASRSPAPPATWKVSFQRFWQRNRGLWLVSMSQLFGALMNVTTRLLELEGEGMNPLQVLFSRMGITMICCCIYMWWKQVPYFPFGMKGVRLLLVLRGFSGFFGIFGMYYSLQYLPIADATVITFLAPAVAGFACYLLLGEPFTRIERIASIVSLLGVVLIARPTSFIHFGNEDFIPPGNSTTAISGEYDFPVPTSGQRIGAIGVSLLGVFGSAGAYTTIRWIGKRAHPLISVNYFAVWCTFVSTTTLAIGTFSPEDSPLHSEHLQFALPQNFRQWGMLIFLGICGFIMQFMMTAGMSHEKSNRATNMVYTNMLFALLFDRWIFGTVPGVWSLLGSGLILGSAVYVAVQKSSPEPRAGVVGLEGRGETIPDEERGMMQDIEPLGEENTAVVEETPVEGELCEDDMAAETADPSQDLFTLDTDEIEEDGEEGVHDNIMENQDELTSQRPALD